MRALIVTLALAVTGCTGASINPVTGNSNGSPSPSGAPSPFASSSIAPSANASPPSELTQLTGQFTAEPNSPCVGDTVTLKGGGLKGASLTVYMYGPVRKDSMGRPLPPDTTVMVGEVPIDQNGNFMFSFELKEKLGPDSHGNSLAVSPGSEYRFKIGGVEGAGPIVICAGK